jgi:NAD(P)-dependent dehydrogenase (short-subunit alcohol dehydrogenase family)
MQNQLFDLSCKCALVTGGSRGIGKAIVVGFAQAGANVAILARDAKALETAKSQIQKQTGKNVWTFSLDLEAIDKIGAGFEEIVKQTGGVDILVNCAGISRRVNAEDLDFADWQKVLGINLSAVMKLSQVFCGKRKQVKQGGKIINIGSLMCHGARPQTMAYTASKSGILGLTKSLAVEWAKYNINVNAIAPGYIATDLTAKLKADKDFDAWVLSRTPITRWGSPEDLVGAAIFLASSASKFVTGQTLYVDGGWTAAV